MRNLLFLTFLLTATGLIGELILIEHMESTWQWVPLITLTTAAIAGIALYKGALKNVARGVMLATIITGLIGIYLHYQGNTEFEKEMYPSLANFELFLKSIKGATPILAPGAMIGLGLLGWALTMFPKSE